MGLRPLFSLTLVYVSFALQFLASRQPLVNAGAVLSLPDGPPGCDVLSVLSGSSFACFVGTLLTCLVRFLGCITALCICLLCGVGC